jgi:hypothetical protein
MNDGPIYIKNEIDRPSKVMNKTRKGCCAAAFDFAEVAVVVVVDKEVDVGREDDGEVGDTESEAAPESNVVEIELGCADSTEDGTGIEDVNSETGLWNEPLI